MRLKGKVAVVLMLIARPITVFACTMPDRAALWSRNELVFLCVPVGLVLLRRGHFHLAMFLATSTILGGLIDTWVKLAVNRDRPSLEQEIRRPPIDKPKTRADFDYMRWAMLHGRTSFFVEEDDRHLVEEVQGDGHRQHRVRVLAGGHDRRKCCDPDDGHLAMAPQRFDREDAGQA